jgi:hypothetical protein
MSILLHPSIVVGSRVGIYKTTYELLMVSIRVRVSELVTLVYLRT